MYNRNALLQSACIHSNECHERERELSLHYMDHSQLAETIPSHSMYQGSIAISAKKKKKRTRMYF